MVSHYIAASRRKRRTTVKAWVRITNAETHTHYTKYAIFMTSSSQAHLFLFFLALPGNIVLSVSPRALPQFDGSIADVFA